MTRNQKLQKLSNAICAYKGTFDASSKKWITAPKKTKLTQVKTWAERLKLDVNEVVARVEGFTTFDSMRKWMKTL